jgi:hypothetical protein
MRSIKGLTHVRLGREFVEGKEEKEIKQHCESSSAERSREETRSAKRSRVETIQIIIQFPPTAEIREGNEPVGSLGAMSSDGSRVAAR